MISFSETATVKTYELSEEERYSKKQRARDIGSDYHFHALKMMTEKKFDHTLWSAYHATECPECLVFIKPAMAQPVPEKADEFYCYPSMAASSEPSPLSTAHLGIKEMIEYIKAMEEDEPEYIKENGLDIDAEQIEKIFTREELEWHYSELKVVDLYA